MKILGISHDVCICSACVVIDGKVVVAIPEERLDRVKQSGVFPVRAIERCLQEVGLRIDEVDEIAVAWNPAIELETTLAGFVNSRRWRVEHMVQVPARLLSIAGKPGADLMSLQGLWEDGPPITFVDHYFAHLGNAVFLSPFDRCAVLTLDGRGEKHTGLLARVEGTDIEVLHEVMFPHSLGLFYGAVTQFLGYKPDGDEWKVMALASFAPGNNEFYPPMRELVSTDERGGFSLALEYFEHFNFWDRRLYSDRFEERFGNPRAGDEPLDERHNKIAAAAQLVFEETAAEVLTRLHQQTGADRLVASGGCFMNSVFNGKISQLTPFREHFIGSCPDDSGTSIGAALYLHSKRTATRAFEVSNHNYWGIEFSDQECWETVARYKLPNVEQCDDPSQRAAEDLANGRLIGWFQGREEFGQRALGNRSILADPRLPGTKDTVNAAVKYREGYRPFAPAILQERVSEYFECGPEMRVPFMEQVVLFREEKRAEVPAVVHVDGSGRLQTVEADSSSRFYLLIVFFEKITNVPIVLNTSFNLNGEPIVSSPEDAIRTFYSCGLDVLYLVNVRISK